MKALLLIGGLATRLYPLSRHLAKSLLPVCDRELLHYQITQIALAGIRDIVLAAGTHIAQLSAFVSGYSGGLRFLISEEEEALGTAGAIANARPLLGDEPVVVLNADILSTLDLRAVIALHQRLGRPATVVGYQVEDPARYGLLKTSGENLLGFSEKPPGTLPPDKYYINAGIYVLEPEACAGIPAGRPVSIERETFPALLDRHGSLSHFAHDGLWIDIGTFNSYFRANFELLGRRYALGPDWLWGERQDSSVFKDLVYLHHSARLGRPVDLFHRAIVMAGADISDNCVLRNSIVMPGAVIGAGCRLTDCIVGPAVTVAEASDINSCVLVQDEPPTPFYPHSAEAS